MRQGRYRDAVPVLAAARAPGDREVRNLLMVSVLSALQDEPAQAPGFAAPPLVADPLVSVVIPTRDRAANVRLFRLVSEVLGAIEAGAFYPIVGWQCKDCGFRSKCWAWK